MEDVSEITFWESLPENERSVVDYLLNLARRLLPPGHRVRFSKKVPYFYFNKRICLIWPASIPGGGIKTGVLLGFAWGNMLNDADNSLIRGQNKRIYYRIYRTLEEIDEGAVSKIIREAVRYDTTFNK